MVLTSGGSTVSRLALSGILGMVSVRSGGEASEAGLALAAAFLRASPPCVLFGVDMASGGGLGAVLRQEDLRKGAVLIGRSTVVVLWTVGVAVSLGPANGAGDFGVVVTKSGGREEAW